jgi:hypothetical protein
MNKIEQIAEAILYEGYNLFPFRESALKNRKRFNFGIVSPKDWVEMRKDEAFFQQTECLIFSEERDFEVVIKSRFLQVEDEADKWQKTLPREVKNKVYLTEVLVTEKVISFVFETENYFRKLEGQVKVSALEIDENLFKLKLILQNCSELSDNENLLPEGILPVSFLSAHTILQVKNGKFISLLETPEEFEVHRKDTQNIGVFPVLVGDEKSQTWLLSSPIILYDFPEVSENSFANFFDGTEIDELMVLSILALTDEEKEEIRKTDGKAAGILEKIENANPQELMKLHAHMNQR